jgi:hypothetical protein
MSCLGSAHEQLEAYEMVEDGEDKTLEEDEVCEMVVDEEDRTLMVVGVVCVTWMVEVGA